MPLLPETSFAEVVVVELMRLSPSTEAWIQCKLSSMVQGENDMMEPTENYPLTHGVAVGKSLVAAGEETVIVLVANCSNEIR